MISILSSSSSSSCSLIQSGSDALLKHGLELTNRDLGHLKSASSSFPQGMRRRNSKKGGGVFTKAAKLSAADPTNWNKNLAAC